MFLSRGGKDGICSVIPNVYYPVEEAVVDISPAPKSPPPNNPPSPAAELFCIDDLLTTFCAWSSERKVAPSKARGYWAPDADIPTLKVSQALS